MTGYLGRLAPTPSGFLHKGHAYTFGVAYYRARHLANGKLLLRVEDLDFQRCKSIYTEALKEDLRWLGFSWQQDICVQSERMDCYRTQLKQWILEGRVYPSDVSRKKIQETPGLQRSPEGEIIFPEILRQEYEVGNLLKDDLWLKRNWRWRVDYGKALCFVDQRSGLKQFLAGVDFGDFLVWSKLGVPSYEMAVVVDDVASGVTEVVRGEDLLVSTARQLLLYEALGNLPPEFYHCLLVKDENGVRLAKSYDSESIRSYRERGYTAPQFWSELSATMDMKEIGDWLNLKMGLSDVS